MGKEEKNIVIVAAYMATSRPKRTSTSSRSW